MDTTKITIKVSRALMHKFNQKVDELFIKRDALINHVLKVEIGYLAAELEGLKLSTTAKRYISGELRRLDIVTVNIVVEKEVAAKLNAVVKETNIIRDAFANRMILFLLSSDILLEWLELPKVLAELDTRWGDFGGELPTSPLAATKYIFNDPLFYLRTAVNEWYKTGLYTIVLPEQKKFTGLTCYMEDKDVPGTAEHEEYQTHLENLWNELELSFQNSSAKEVNQ